MPMHVRTVLAPIACAAAWLCVFDTAQADAALQHELNIERQPLAGALQEFAKQAGVQIIFFSAVADGCEALPLNGRFTTQAALERLLDDSPLSFREINANTIEIYRNTGNRGSNTLSGEVKMSDKAAGNMQCAQLAANAAPRRRGWTFSGAIMAAAATASATAADAPPAPTGSVELEEVLITAQRRTENLQRASIAIDVVSADELSRASVVSPYDLNRVVPSLQISNGGPFTQTYVRGLGTNSRNQYGDPTVTFNQDGVVIDRPNAIGPIFYDLARVEVLKGPQGTLYGRNATGGAINVLSQAPTDRNEGFVSAEVGNYQTYNLTGAWNLAAGDAWAFRVSTQVKGRDSYLSGGYPAGSEYRDTNSQAVRLQSLWRPSADFSLRLMGEVARNLTTGDNQVRLYPNGTGSGDEWLGAANPVANAGLTAVNPNQNLFRSDDNIADTRLSSLTAELNWNVGIGTLTVIPSYRYTDTRSISYDSATRLDYHEYSKQESVEARLARDEENFKWVAGVFYFDNDRTVYNDALINQVSQRATSYLSDLGSRSWAGFADATVTVVNRLRALGGVRYTTEKKTLAGVRLDTDNNVPPAVPYNFSLDNSRRFNATTWRAGLEYDVAKESMAFLTVARGFKSGGFYTVPVPNDFKPETLMAYTLGLRNRFLNNQLQVNVEAFHWRYKDNQQSVTSFDVNNQVALVTLNAGNANLSGLALDVVAQLSAHDTLSFNGEYLHSKYTTFNFVVPPFFTSIRTGCDVSAVTAGRRTVDCSGFPLPRAPEKRIHMGYDHDFMLGQGATLTASLSGNYESSKYLSIDYLPQGRADSTITGDIDIIYQPSQRKYSIGAYVHNVSNEATYSGGSQNSGIPGVFYGVIGVPRTYGVRSRVNF